MHVFRAAGPGTMRFCHFLESGSSDLDRIERTSCDRVEDDRYLCGLQFRIATANGTVNAIEESSSQTLSPNCADRSPPTVMATTWRTTVAAKATNPRPYLEPRKHYG